MKTYIKNVVLILSLLMIFSCNKEKPTVRKVLAPKIVKDSIQKSNNKISVETFEFPQKIEGCSCYFAKNKADFDAQKYIYADDFGKFTFVKLNGKNLKLNLTSSNSPEESNDLTKEAEDDNYKISIDAKKMDEQQETLMFQGIMTIESTSGEKIRVPIYGECGC